MGRTRRSGYGGEALLLQFHIAGPHRGVGSFSRPALQRLAQARAAGRRPSMPAAGWSAVLCLRAGKVHCLDAPESDEIVALAGQVGGLPRRSLMPWSPIDDLWPRGRGVEAEVADSTTALGRRNCADGSPPHRCLDLRQLGHGVALEP
jgi:hypothetical protein